MNYVTSALQVSGVALGLILLFLLVVRHSLPKYSVLFAYNLVQVLITLIEAFFFREENYRTLLYFRTYWTAEFIWDFLLLLLVVTLIQQVLAGRPELRIANKVVAVVLIGVGVLPF